MTRGDVDAGRRGFLGLAGATAGSAWLATHWPAVLAAGEAAAAARDRGDALSHLSAEDAADLEAIAAQIIPTDDTPGAREAGVIYFIDRAVGTLMGPGAAGSMREALEDFNADVREAAGAPRFARLDAKAQEAFLRSRAADGFWQQVRFLTVAGMFSMPSYGGNREHVGWQLLGFDHHHGWEPPFGHYDAAALSADDGDDDGDA